MTDELASHEDPKPPIRDRSLRVVVGFVGPTVRGWV
jgi:hypothetical protein